MKKLFIITVLLFMASCIPQHLEPYKGSVSPQVLELKIIGVDAVKIEENSGDGIARSMTIRNPDGELSSMTFVSEGQGYFKLFSYIGALDSTNMWQDIVILKSMGVDTLNIMINSGGGSAYDGLALADSVAYAKTIGLTTNAYAVGLCASAAVPVFAAAQNRYATSSAQFMVHKAKLGKYLAYEDADELKSQQSMLSLLREKYVNIMVNGSNLSAEAWEDKIKSTTYFGAEEAIEWGLVHEIQ
jgi:ATP-dependent Clp protease protease subunit